jgi:hypothetical protein
VLALLVRFGRSAPSVGGSVLSMNPLSLEGTTMVPTTFIRIRSLFGPRRVRGDSSHPDAVSEVSLNLPRRIDDPTSAAQLCDRPRPTNPGPPAGYLMCGVSRIGDRCPPSLSVASASAYMTPRTVESKDAPSPLMQFGVHPPAWSDQIDNGDERADDSKEQPTDH